MKTRLLKLNCVTLLLLSLSLSVFAQQKGTIAATLQDANNNEPVIGAVIEFYPTSKPTEKKYISSDVTGKFSIPSLSYGEYNLSISFLGLTTLEKKVTLNKSSVQLGTLKMVSESRNIETVTVAGTAIRTSTKGDTISYNAAAYKVTKDANTEDILAKMPGVSVENGTVKAQGEDVKKILVDGKEFFGEDVTTAIKNLPAEAIDRIESFSKLSDQAEFSGVDDGNSYRAINIVTKKNMNRGVFGKLSAGYGYDDKYLIGANVNFFKDNRRISLVGLANNINKTDFSTDDMLGVVGNSTGSGGGRGGGSSMVGSRGGISTVKSIGLNYSNQWWEKLKFSGNYSFNITDNITTRHTDREYYLSADSTQYYNALSNRPSTNTNHRLDARIDYKINDRNNIMIRPRVSFQNYSANNVDTSSMMLTSSALERAMLNMFKSISDINNSGYNVGGSMLYQHKFGGRDGRVLSIDFNGSASNRDGITDNYTLTKYFAPEITNDPRDQNIYDLRKSYSLGGGMMYTEPITKKSQLLFRYSLSYNYQDRDRRSYLYNAATESYNFADSLSNTFNSGYLTHRAGPGFRYNSGKTMLIFGVDYQYATLDGNKVFPISITPNTSKAFNNLLYMGVLTVKFNSTNNLRVHMRSNTNNPDVSDLQNVLDITNPLFITQGNSNLRPVYSNSLYANYTRTNIEKGRTFNANFGGSMYSNYITNSTVIADRNNYQVTDEQGNLITTLDRGSQYSKPINMDGYWDVRGNITYGAPVKFIKSNVDFTLRTSYRSMPGVFNNEENTTNSQLYGGGVKIGSNISENLDFTLFYNAGYNIAKNAKRPQSNNDYFSHSASGSVKWITWAGITLNANANYYQYKGITTKFNDEYLILNASIGKKLFKSQRGEVNIAVNDILNQNKSFVRNITASYIENVTSNALGRFVSLNFIYNIRNFAGKSVPASVTPDSFDRRPPGGFGGGSGFGGSNRPPH